MPRSASSSSTSRYDRPKRRYQRTASTITSGGKQKPAKADRGTVAGRGRRVLMTTVCLLRARSQHMQQCPVAGPGGLEGGATEAPAQPTTEPPSSSSIAAAEARPGPSVQAHPAVHPAADLLGQRSSTASWARWPHHSSTSVPSRTPAGRPLAGWPRVAVPTEIWSVSSSDNPARLWRGCPRGTGHRSEGTGAPRRARSRRSPGSPCP